MWFGTDSGLARFDGRMIQSIPLGEGGGARVFALASDANGMLWIVTEKGAFLYLNQQFFPITGGSKYAINAILPGEPTLLATGDGPIFRVTVNPDGSTQAFDIFQDPPGRVTALIGQAGKYIVGTSGDGRHIYEIRDGVTSE